MRSINSILNEKEIERIGRLSGFVKRKSKLAAFKFLMSLMFSRFDGGNKLSLNDLSNELYDKFHCYIKRQSVNERFNPEAVGFVKQAVDFALSEKLSSGNKIGFLNNFTAVKIQDSTSFQLPGYLAEHYGGCLWSIGPYSVRIRYQELRDHDHETDLGELPKRKIFSGQCGKVSKGELVIRDLV